MPFPAPADTYPTKDPVADYLQAYATAHQLPVRLGARVVGLRRTEDGDFQVRTADETYRARQVVVATGPFQVPFVPPMAGKLDAQLWIEYDPHPPFGGIDWEQVDRDMAEPVVDQWVQTELADRPELLARLRG
jgi:hypothetical protein